MLTLSYKPNLFLIGKEELFLLKRTLRQLVWYSPLGEVELVESNRTAERVLRVLGHLQDFLFTLLLLTLLGRNLWVC